MFSTQSTIVLIAFLCQLFSFFHLDLESTQDCSHRHNQLKSIYNIASKISRSFFNKTEATGFDGTNGVTK
jgi:hypothetical protein